MRAAASVLGRAASIQGFMMGDVYVEIESLFISSVGDASRVGIGMKKEVRSKDDVSFYFELW